MSTFKNQTPSINIIGGKKKTKDEEYEPPKLHIENNSKMKEQLARVSRYFMECGEHCLRSYFQVCHADEELSEHYANPETHKVLRRLKIKNMLTDYHWKLLFPVHKNDMSSKDYDIGLLLLLVKHICQIAKPQADGWTTEPHLNDHSTSAALIRLQSLRKQLANLTTINTKIMSKFFKDIKSQLEVLDDEFAVLDYDMMRKNKLDDTETSIWLDMFLQWHVWEEHIWQCDLKSQQSKRNRPNDIPMLQNKIETKDWDSVSKEEKKFKAKLSKRKSIYPNKGKRWSNIKTGMVEEEREILDKYYERLLQEVRPDYVVEALMARDIVTGDESTEIFSTLRQNEQMSTLIDFLVPKSGNIFEELLNSFKYKNESLYQAMFKEYQSVMAEILANKPQGLPYCHETLKNRYKTAFENWVPIPWYGSCKTDIDSFYCDQQMLDLHGKSVDVLNAFKESKNSTKDVKWTVVEGDPGTGKTTLAKYLAYRWTKDQDLFGKHYSLLVLLDLKIIAPTMKAMMIEQLFGGDFKLTERELYEIIDDNQEDTLIILDGYEDNLNDEIKNLLFNATMPDAHILLFSQTNFTVRLQGRYDRKIILTGFANNAAQSFVKKYIKLSKKPQDYFASFLDKITERKKPQNEVERLLESVKIDQDDIKKLPQKQEAETSRPSSTMKEDGLDIQSRSKSIDTSKKTDVIDDDMVAANAIQAPKIAAIKHYSQVPLYCSFFCLLTDMRLSIDINSPTSIVEQFTTATKMKLIEREKESRFGVNKAYSIISEIAMDTIKKGSATLTIRERDNDIMCKFGYTQEATNLTTDVNTKYLFSNRLIQEYLAAKNLDSIGVEEAARFFQNVPLTPASYNVIVFYCSLKKSDSETLATRELFQKILQYNVRRGKANMIHEKSDALVWGKIMDFQLSLECMAVMEMRSEMAKNMSKSLPSRFIVKHEGIMSRLALSGLSKVLNMNYSIIQELDIKLDLLSRQTLEAYKNLAEAIKNNMTISTLRIYWTEKDLMADFLKSVSAVTIQKTIKKKAKGPNETEEESHRGIQNLMCIDDSVKRSDQLNAQVLKDIRESCVNFEHLESFAFQNCRHQALVNLVIKNLPVNLKSVDLSGSELTIISAQDLNDKLQQSKQIERLVMANIRVEGMAFNTFINAFSNNRSIKELNLSGVRLDSVCFFALTEALKINNKLEVLDLRRIPMNVKSCQEIIQILKINKTIKVLYISTEKVTFDGHELLKKQKTRAKIDGLLGYEDSEEINGT